MATIKTTAVKAKPKKQDLINAFLLDIKFQVIVSEEINEMLIAQRTSHSKLTKADSGRLLSALVKEWEKVIMPDFRVKRKKAPKVKAGAELGDVVKRKAEQTVLKAKKVKRFKAGPELAKAKSNGVRTEVQGKKNND